MKPEPDDGGIPEFLQRRLWKEPAGQPSFGLQPSSSVEHKPVEPSRSKPSYVPMGMTEQEYEETKTRLEREATAKKEVHMATKWKIVPYDAAGEIIQRGVTSVAAGTEQIQLYAKMAHAYHRCAKGSVHKVIVHDAADGYVREWVEGRDAPLPEPEKEEPAPVKAKAKGNSGKTKTSPGKVSKEKPAKGPPTPKGKGVIAMIVEMIGAKGGASMDEMIKALSKQFPNRNENSMRSTIQTQMGRQKAHKRQDDKRGTVWSK